MIHTVRLFGERLRWTLYCFPVIAVPLHGILTESQDRRH